MEEKIKMIKRVGLISVVIGGIAMLLSLFFKDKTITAGIGLGCMIGLIGFNMIVQWGYRVEGEKSHRSAYFNYMMRLLFYACMFVICYLLGANLVAVLVGFICHKIAVFLYSYKS